MSDQQITIGFVALINPEWVAGTKYLINLWSALRSASEAQYTMVLLVPPTAQPKDYDSLASFVDRIVPYPPHKKNIPLPFVNKIRKRYFYIPDAYLRSQGIDVLFSSLDSGAREIPRIHWLPDFQHLYYPEFFTANELEWRADMYPRAAREATVPVVSSQAAQEDLARWLPAVSTKIRVLNFVAQIPHNVYDGNAQQVSEYYHLPERFFFLPNQFWKHKNHALVLDALAIACKMEPALTVVCTGTTLDYRDPLYFDTLLARVSAMNLQSNFRLLGRVPEDHLYQLMRGSLALLQPSLFEGWSTSVEESKTIGKRAIVSDIPVHREQCPLEAKYFDPRDADALATVLIECHSQTAPGPDLRLEEQSRRNLPERMRTFAHTFDSIVSQALHV